MLNHFAVTKPQDLISEIYDRQLPHHALAQTARLVQQARDEGDEVGTQILEQAAHELVRAARSVVERLHMQEEAVQFVLAGGVFTGVPWLSEELKRRLPATAPRGQVRRLEVEPASELVVESWWKDGQRIHRRTYTANERPLGVPPRDAAVSEEVVTGEGPLYVEELFFTLGLVPGRDGVKAEIDGKVAYATVDDLLGLQAYDRAHLWVAASFGWGTHRATVLHVLSEQRSVEALVETPHEDVGPRHVRKQRRCDDLARRERRGEVDGDSLGLEIAGDEQ